ncbi:M64 family metallopeptidase, partial [Bacteroides acidifaciens]
NFASKWKDILPSGTPIPTPITERKEYPVGVYEGGGYSAKGIYRPAYDCRMKTNSYPEFCPVCQRAIRRMIKFYVP